MTKQAEQTPCVFATGFRESYYTDRRLGCMDPSPVVRPTDNYGRLELALRKAGTEPYIVTPDWSTQDPWEWVLGFAYSAIEAAYENKRREVILGGFSMGSDIAFQAADLITQSSEVTVTGFIGASTSASVSHPWQYMSHIQPVGGIEQYSEAQKAGLLEFSFPDSLQGVPMVLLAGTREIGIIRQLHAALLRQYPHAIAVTPPCEHDMLDSSYLRGIEENVGQLALQQDIAYA